jgi:beta-ribofuranosylaminobenzene 5'-phosphate synthase
MPRVVYIVAPSRLHFGLWSLSGTGARAFGGVGAMIGQPAVELLLTGAGEFHVRGGEWERAFACARRWAKFHRRELPDCCIDIHSAIPMHSGLGSGTQFGLSVAAGLNAYCGLPSQSPQELAQSVGRGLRSAVGTYGFVFGGLIVEQGKLPDEPISPLDCRIDLPEHWRFVLVRPKRLVGLAGDVEAEAFGALPTVPPAVTEDLIAEVSQRLVPAAATGDFPLFAASLYRYGRLSGEIFSARQGGPYNGPVVTSIIEQIRRLGHVGVGQSSWGPTVYVALPSQEAAEQLNFQLGAQKDLADLERMISSPCNRGAQIVVSGDSTHNSARLPSELNPAS